MAMERAFIRQRLFKLVYNKLHAKVRRFEAHIKTSYEGVVFELLVSHGPLMRKVIELTWIIVNDRKQGIGTAIMRELCDFADRNAAEISLKPASKGDYAATTSRGRLVRFYKRFGFVVEKAKPAEFMIIPKMIRQPVG
jgi:ribosomal protein S18 acetylase RimI-like enzyme